MRLQRSSFSVKAAAEPQATSSECNEESREALVKLLSRAELMTDAPTGSGSTSDACSQIAALAFIAGGMLLCSHEPASAAELSDRSGLAVNSTMALAEGPFWDNVLRFVVYFFTVLTGGLVSLLQPMIELSKRPVTLLLLIAVLGGGFFLMYLTLNAMLGIEGSPDFSVTGY